MRKINGTDTELDKQGWLWKRGAISPEHLQNLPNESSRDPNIHPAMLNACLGHIEEFLPGAFPVRATLFSKSSSKSWALGWHQDRVIPVTGKHDVEGYTHWTRKKNIWHAEPPEQVFKQTLFAQIYFDSVSRTDGPTELASGSHKFGKIYKDDKDRVLSSSPKHLCLAEAGDILICKPLILHRSIPSKSKNSRRILRLDFANLKLPAPLQWAEITGG